MILNSLARAVPDSHGSYAFVDLPTVATMPTNNNSAIANKLILKSTEGVFGCGTDVVSLPLARFFFFLSN